jgi:hypothetical protein
LAAASTPAAASRLNTEAMLSFAAGGMGGGGGNDGGGGSTGGGGTPSGVGLSSEALSIVYRGEYVPPVALAGGSSGSWLTTKDADDLCLLGWTVSPLN